MATILQFKSPLHKPQAAPASGAADYSSRRKAEIHIFPGVRIERKEARTGRVRQKPLRSN